jgi:phage terminase large subunit-like protein
MIYMDEELADTLIVRESRKEIYCPANGSLYKALSSEVKGKHGFGPAVLFMDELAQFGADRVFFDTLQQGQGAHEEPLLGIISTQAADDLAVLSQEIDYGLKCESGEVDDPTVRCFLFTTPTTTGQGEDAKEVDPFNPENWSASNPALGDFLSLADMESKARTAKNMPSAEAGFRNLRLNQRIDAATHWISRTIWLQNGGEIDRAVFEDYPVRGGLDLSGKNDLSALVFVAENNDSIHHILPFFWCPKEGIKERGKRDGAPYQQWVDEGHLEATPGKTIDYRYIARKLGGLSGIMNIEWLRFDRWRIEDFQRAMIDEGVDCWIWGKDWKEENKLSKPSGICLIPHGQGFRDMNPSIEAAEDLLSEQRIRHGMNPVLTYCVSNVRISKDPAGNRKFDKLKATGRIDGAQAMVMSLSDTKTIEENEIQRGVLEL